MAKKPKPMSKVTAAKAARKLQIIYRKYLKKKLTIKELTEMLLYLRDEYVSVTYGKGILTVQTEDIVSSHYSQSPGQAVIIINLKKAFVKEKVYLEYGVQIQIPDGHRFPHRHVFSGSDLCFGNSYSACKKSVMDGRLDDCIAIIQQVLRS